MHIVPVDTVILVGSGIAFLLTVLAFSGGWITPRSALTIVATYMMVIGVIGIVDAVSSWITGVARTARRAPVLGKDVRVRALFNLVWGLCGLVIGGFGLLVI